MKKTLIGLASAAVIAAAAFTVPAFAMDKITIATEGAYEPWNYKDSAGNLVGFELDLAKELCARMKADCTVVEQAWDGIIPALTAKKYDAIMAGMSITEERMKVISFSRSYTSTPIGFATLKSTDLSGVTSDIEFIGLDEVDDKEKAAIDALKTALAGKTVGVQGGTTHENFMKEFMADIALKSYDTMDNMVLDLEAGRIDAGYSDTTFLAPLMEKNPDIVMFGAQMDGGPLGAGVGVGLRQEDTALRDKFSEAINSMIADGSLAALAVKWFKTDIAPKE